jgi:transcriptional regulator with XRE-family HTH domain
MEKETFGARLLKRRKDMKLSQVALGKLVGVAHVTISQWEREETQPVGKRLFALSKGLQCTPTWLLFGDEDQTPGEPSGEIPQELTETQKTLLALFDELPEPDQEGFINELQARIENNNRRLEELLMARKKARKK